MPGMPGMPGTAGSDGAAPQIDPEVMKQMGSAAGGSKGMMGMLESMMEDPKMQEMFYPYLPEPFRNPETFKWMMNTPEIRAQIEQQLDQAMSGNMSPDMANMMGQAGGMDADVNQQFEQMGVSPEEVMKKIMERPDLAAKFQNPKVQQAMMDITQNPQNISKYYADTDVMSLMTEMSQLFPNLAGGGGPPPV